MRKHFRRLPHFFFFISPTVTHTNKRHGRIYLASFSSAASVRVESWNLHDVVSRPETLLPFLRPSYLRSRIPSDGHANSTVNWIVSCTSNLSLIRCGARWVQILESSDVYDNSSCSPSVFAMKSNYAVEMDIVRIKRKKCELNNGVYEFLDRNWVTFHLLRDVIFFVNVTVLQLISANVPFIIHMIKASVRLCVLELAATTWKRSFRFIETTSSLICNI